MFCWYKHSGKTYGRWDSYWLFLAENIVAAAGIKTDYIKEVRRQGRKGSGKPGALKIRLVDKHIAMSVLRTKNLPHDSFSRKDLTKREFLIDKQFWKDIIFRTRVSKDVVRNL